MGFLPNQAQMVKYSCEFLGTLVLSFFVAWSLGYSRTPFAPMLGGFLLSAIIYALGPKSGAHVNPALTLTLFLADPASFGVKDLVYYIIFQLLGGIAGALLKAGGVEHNPSAFHISFTNNEDSHAALAHAFGAEVLGVGFFFWLIVQIAADTSNMYYGIGIGMANMAAVTILAPISGAGLNPAVVIGNNLVADIWSDRPAPHGVSLTLRSTPVYVVAELMGGLLALALLRMTTEPPPEPEKPDVEEQPLMMTRRRSLLTTVHRSATEPCVPLGLERPQVVRRCSMLLPIPVEEPNEEQGLQGFLRRDSTPSESSSASVFNVYGGTGSGTASNGATPRVGTTPRVLHPSITGSS